MKFHQALAAILLRSWLLVGCMLPIAAPAQLADGSSAAASSSDSDPARTARRPVVAELAALQQDMMAVLAGLSENHDGEVYSQAVEGTQADDLAAAVALIDGQIISDGATTTQFPLMSVSKPFTYALAVEQHGTDFMLERIGVSATGLPYNAVAAGAVRPTSEQNPMVNAGAIATHSYIEGATSADKIAAVVDLYSRMANRPLAVNEAWRATPRALTFTLAYQMQTAERLEGDVEDVTRRYLESNIVAVSVVDLAWMGATLASGGVQPVTGQRVLEQATVRTVLSAMVIAGMYQDSGLWWVQVGVPAKSGVSGAILAVVPGWGAIAAYSPRLDAAGNSVRAAAAIQQLVRQWRLHDIDRLVDAAAADPARP